MERFRKFADETTGEHPFLPVKQARTSEAVLKGLAVLVFRLVLILLFVVTYLLSAGFERFFPKAVVSGLYWLQQRFLFWGLSIEINDSGVQPTRHGRRVLTISNLSSFLDLYYLRGQ